MSRFSLGFVRRPLFWLNLAFLLSTASFLSFPPLAALLGMTLLLAFLWHMSRGTVSFFLPLLLAAALLGFANLEIHSMATGAGLLALLESNEPISVTMTVEESEQNGAYLQCSGYAELSDGARKVKALVTVSGYQGSAPAPGNTFVCQAKSLHRYTPKDLLIEPPRLTISQQLPSQGISPPSLWRTRLAKIKNAISSQIDRLDGGLTGSVLRAVLVGDRSGLSDQTVQAFRKSGMSHLLVVSGMHLVILCQIFSIFLRLLKKPKLTAALVILLCWLFAGLTGFGISILRASVMMTFAQIGPLIRQRSDTLTSLSIAGVCLTIASPGAVVSASFLLSFCSVASIALLSEPITSFLTAKKPGVVREYLAATIATGVAAQIGSAPALLLLFKSFPLWGTIANLLVVELLPALMIVGILAVLLSFPLGVPNVQLPLSFCRWIVVGIDRIAQFFAARPLSGIGLTAWFQVGALAAFLVLLIALFAYQVERPFVKLALLSWLSISLSAAALSLWMGAGQATLLITRFGTAAFVRGQHAVIVGAPQDFRDYEVLSKALGVLGVLDISIVLAAEGEAVDVPVYLLCNDFGGPRTVAASDSALLRSFCEMARLHPGQIPESVRIWDRLSITRVEKGYRVDFLNGYLLKNNTTCAIMGKYRQAFPISNDVVHLRIDLEE